MIRVTENDKNWIPLLQTAITQNNGNSLTNDIWGFSVQTFPTRYLEVTDSSPAELNIIRDANGNIEKVRVVIELNFSLQSNFKIVKENAILGRLEYCITLNDKNEPMISETKVNFADQMNK